ncbi:uncharacterized protein M421DRAFT_159867 [Didymella exigua CBS 183.55]|uniref:Uncharacterized protein n=1 Tax=Didymella exigua CBS 183.55 TaxID=1150837 RepID=A0A6A5RM93_9PLEO|nr:uncharacterized protein M421DRAFT_159867 [Didymella exigua CBS 183.55]KAF1928390.1 hypothetical protein M421DRAFT_159867 [Didymella exigua CBS 183.55]
MQNYFQDGQRRRGRAQSRSNCQCIELPDALCRSRARLGFIGSYHGSMLPSDIISRPSLHALPNSSHLCCCYANSTHSALHSETNTSPSKQFFLSPRPVGCKEVVQPQQGLSPTTQQTASGDESGETTDESRGAFIVSDPPSRKHHVSRSHERPANVCSAVPLQGSVIPPTMRGQELMSGVGRCSPPQDYGAVGPGGGPREDFDSSHRSVSGS